ncbi:MAG TPA: hypothetical protein VHG30_10325 [Microvirga sp.]|nr:hypothetical protein [Microvirga sp.]
MTSAPHRRTRIPHRRRRDPDGFVIALGFGKDIITGCESGPGAGDDMRFDPALFGGGPARFDAVPARAADDGPGNVIARFDAAMQLSTVGVTGARLTAHDFGLA